MKLADIPNQDKSLHKKILSALSKTINGGQFILGKNVEALEKKISKLTGTKHAIGVNSGTDALLLSLKALRIGPGDEVITTPFSFVASAEAILLCGAKPIFIDIDPETFNIDPKKIEKAISKKTKAILPVHLFGQMANMAAIRKIAKKNQLTIVEDAAQALGAKQKTTQGNWRAAGSLGDLGCFSFFPTKNLGAYGDGGIVTTNDKKLADTIRSLRTHGAEKKYRHELIGYNSRLDELQATILLAKLPSLSQWNKKRIGLAAIYNKRLSSISKVKTPVTTKNNLHIYNQYTIRTKSRDALKDHLKKQGVPTAIHYPLSIHQQPAIKKLKLHRGKLPETEKAAREVLSLPLHPTLTKTEQNKVIKSISSFFS